ncbi:MAG: autotransporter domain-containing protein [Planctomycetes bacterium]|nr:autotransporter domain-containing protein [Planctomycetota bacterium]
MTTTLADGGNGGTSNDLSTGGAGGAGANGTAGSPGNSSGSQGGGGGGGGAGGGTGGVGGTGAGAGGAGGTGGTVGVPNGGTGGDGSLGGGGGGGGGGYNGNGSGSATITNGSPLTGGNGGTGGNGANGGGGGGGGAGGYGAIITGSGASSNSSSITGGNGGTGGGILSGTGSGGNGGDGGVGLQFTGLNSIFTNSGTVTGGDGGTGGIGGSNGTPGIGGVGIIGSSLNVINSGTIGGGLSGDGLTRANAITFSGGNNTLELQSGYSFVGNVVGSSGDTLKLGGTTNDSFDVSQIGPAALFQGFSLFEKTGSSTWTLTGTTAVATPWAINQGTLSISADSNLGASGPISFDGGTLQFGVDGITSSRTITLNAGGGTFDTQSFTATLNGQLTGLGGVGVTGNGGTLILTNSSNDYTGTTTVDATNTLIATDNSLSGVTGALTNNGTTIFQQSVNSSGVFGGDISNAGSLIFTQATGTTGTYGGAISDGASAGTVEIGGTGGGGTFNFTGVNTYTGATTVDATNTLIATDNSLSGVTGALTNNGTTIFQQTVNSSGVFGGDISNAGSLIFTQATGTTGTYGGAISDGASAGTVEIGGIGGGGTFNFTGTNTYSGLTTVDNGNTLIVNGSVTGAVSVDGTLMGQGSVGTTTIQSGGTLQPGTAGAPLTINGNLTQAAGSTFAVGVNPAANEKVIVNGSADISSSGTSLHLTVAPGSYTPGQSYTLLTATGGLTGTFASTVQSGGVSNLMFVEKYLPNELDLVVLPTSVGSGDIYANMASIGVQTTTAELQLISNRLAGLAGPYSPNSGVTSAGQSVGAVQLASSSANGPVRVLPCQSYPQNASTWTTWAQGYGLAGNLSGGFNYGLGGTVFGADRWLDENNMVGLLGGYAGTSLGQSQTNAHSQINGYQIGLYELHRQELFYLSNIDAFSNSTYKVSREAAPGQTATGNSYGNQWSHYTEAGVTLGDGAIRIQPFAGLQYIYLDQRGFTESGAGNLNMTTNSQIVNSTRGNLGLRLSHDLYWGGIRVVPTVGARYQREWGNGTQLLSSSFQGAPTLIYSTTGGKTGRDFGLFSLGGTAFLTNHCSLFGSVDTQVASYYTAVMGSGGFQLVW